MNEIEVKRKNEEREFRIFKACESSIRLKSSRSLAFDCTAMNLALLILVQIENSKNADNSY